MKTQVLLGQKTLHVDELTDEHFIGIQFESMTEGRIVRGFADKTGKDEYIVSGVIRNGSINLGNGTRVVKNSLKELVSELRGVIEVVVFDTFQELFNWLIEQE